MNRSDGVTKTRHEVILAGAGGQGLILSSMVLGEGAVREGKNVVQTQSYGISARGGLSVAELIIDTDEIIFQQVMRPDVVLALTDKAMERFGSLADKGALILYDNTYIDERTGENLWGIPFTRMAASLGQGGAANLIALGAMVALAGIITMDSLIWAVSRAFPEADVTVPVKALRLGESLITAARTTGSAEGDPGQPQ